MTEKGITGKTCITTCTFRKNDVTCELKIKYSERFCQTGL